MAHNAKHVGSVTFSVKGQPVGKGRPRAFSAGGKIGMHTPRKTANYETHVRLAYQSAAQGRPPHDGPVGVSVYACCQAPKGMSKWLRALLPIPRTQKPDADNVLKVVLDGLNGVAFKDDAQVFDVRVLKHTAEGAGVCVQVVFYAAPSKP